MQKVLNESLNTGAVFAMQKMGKDKFRDYVLGYGFGEKTGIELPQEGKNNISNIIGNSREIEYATASFGQGIAVTPIAMVSALSSSYQRRLNNETAYCERRKRERIKK